MDHDESQHQGDEYSQSGEPPQEIRAPMKIDTTDPVIETAVEHQSDWKIHPDSTVAIETTQVNELDLPSVSGVRTINDRDYDREPGSSRDQRQDDGDRGNKKGNPQDRQQVQNSRTQNRGSQQARPHDDDRGRDEDDRGDDRSQRERQPRQQQPSMMKNLLITASVALVCGVIGAMGYSHFFGPKSDGSSSDQSRGKSESGSKKESSANSTEKSGGGEGQDSGKESNAQASTTSSISGVTSAKDLDMINHQIMDLSRRVDQLRERIDRATRPTDQTPPVLRTMQIKIGELAHEMAEVAALPAVLRHHDTRLESLQEEVKALRARIEASHADSIGGRNPSLTPPSAIVAPASARGGSTAGSPTMDLGIGQLERGEYASARETFVRLQGAQPDDARVWYLSALAAGLTSGNWDGDAKRLAEKGLERERAGHPSTASIDATLATATPIKGEDWIASLRRNVLNK